MSDSVLKRITAGDASAMQACIDTYGGLVWSLARRFSVSAAEAEDGVQEVFIALWENAGRFDETVASEVTFVAMIARRRLIDRGRKRERRQRVVDAVTQQAEGSSPEPPRDPVALSDDVARAGAAMETLSQGQQQVLALAINHGFTHEQIAQHTGLPLGTVKTHARRGLIRVRDVLNAPAAAGSGEGRR